MIEQSIDVHAKFRPLYQSKRFKLYYGGRGGMKTFEFSRALVIMGAQRKLNIFCGRQFQESLEDSVKESVEEQIYLLGMENEYHIQNEKISHRITGTKFKFKGLERNIASKKGWNHVDILWIEEANTLLQKTIEILFPSIRKKGSEIWMSMNRGRRVDPIDKMFLSHNAVIDDAVIVKVGWRDNPYFPEELEKLRQLCLRLTPERYAHIWEGEPDDGAGLNIILPYDKLLLCVGAAEKLKYKPSGLAYSGLDVADAGNDTNAWAKRHSALLEHVREWKVKYLHMTASKADLLNRTENVSSMNYDAGGLGAGIKSDLSRIPGNPQTGASPGTNKFIPFHFGGKVKGGNRYYIRHKDLKIRNKDFFHRANSQLWWNIKLRMENTIKALDGENVDLDKCFFISKKIMDIEKVLAELTQGVYDDSSGKIVVNKAPDGAPSPNLADGVLLSFAHDIRRGLKAI